MKFFMTLFALSFFVFSAQADRKVTCSTVAKKRVKLLDYTISSNKSSRLLSGITVYKNNSSELIFPQYVAQYGTAEEAVYFLVDNDSEIPVLRLYAKESKKKYIGTVANYGSTGAVVKTTAVECIISVL